MSRPGRVARLWQLAAQYRAAGDHRRELEALATLDAEARTPADIMLVLNLKMRALVATIEARARGARGK